MKKTYALTLCAVLAALSVVLMLLGSLFEVLDLSTVILASICVLYADTRISQRHAWMLYGVTAILALLLLPSKAVALEYLLFGGYYPILRARVARLGRIVSWGIKLLVFNGALTLLILSFRTLFVSADLSYTWDLITYALGNVSLILYDYALGRIGTLFLLRLRPRFGRKNN